jgi:sulfide:quinone oxidoreductase
MTEKKTVIIAGGGIGGILAANELRQRLTAEHRVLLIEKNPVHAFAPSFLWLMVGKRQEDKVCKPLASLLHPGVELVLGRVEGLDASKRSLHTSQGTLHYDALILALGAELAPELIPGLGESAFSSFYTLEASLQLRQTLRQFSGGKIALVVSSMPYKCPGAPHEGAMLLADFFKQRGLAERVEIDLYTPEPQPMPVGGPQLGRAVVQMLAMKGVAFHPLHQLTAVDGAKRQLLFEGREAVGYDLLIVVPPHRAPALVREAGLSNQAGWVPVDRLSLQTNTAGIYALGDLTALPLPGRWKEDIPLMLPKAGVFAHAQAEVVAQRVAGSINGTPSTAEFCGKGYCMLEAGGGFAGFAYGNFFAEPAPELEMRELGRAWHWGKILFEQWWLAPFGPRKSLLHAGLQLGTKVFRIPMKM